MLDKEKVLRYMQMTQIKKMVVRENGFLYLCRLETDPGNQYTDPYDFVFIEEIPPIIEFVT
jgi:hypothetical protein